VGEGHAEVGKERVTAVAEEVTERREGRWLLRGKEGDERREAREGLAVETRDEEELGQRLDMLHAVAVLEDVHHLLRSEAGEGLEVGTRGAVEVEGRRCAVAEILVELLHGAVVDGLGSGEDPLRASYARAKEEGRKNEEDRSHHRRRVLGDAQN
jgi:hypothetical protein